jgi:hypothetical protein
LPDSVRRARVLKVDFTSVIGVEIVLGHDSDVEPAHDTQPATAVVIWAGLWSMHTARRTVGAVGGLPGWDESKRDDLDEDAGVGMLAAMRSRAAWYTAVGAVRAHTGCDGLQAQAFLDDQPEDRRGAADRLLAAVEARAEPGIDPDASWD